MKKQIKQQINTISVKNEYCIIDNFIYEISPFKNIESKEKLMDYFNVDDLKNKVLSGRLLSQLNLYFKDNFTIKNISACNEILKISLENKATLSTAKLEYVFNTEIDKILEQIKKPILNSDLTKDFILSCDDIAKIKTALKYICKDELRQVLCNILISKNKVLSCDGLQMYFND